MAFPDYSFQWLNVLLNLLTLPVVVGANVVLVATHLLRRITGTADPFSPRANHRRGDANYQLHPSFPPKELVDRKDRAALSRWYLDRPYVPKPHKAITPREKELLQWTAAEYIAARRANRVTCLEYASVLVKRMLHFRDTQMFAMTSYECTDVVLRQAQVLDQQAAADGVEIIGPLFGLPIPAKGTMATTDFPSSAGCPLLAHFKANKDADMVTLVRKANGVIFGKTNVPDFAASWVTMNARDGRTMNLYDGHLTSGGSSGGSACAVAAHVAPVALTEDTGGSTRHPATQNNNFGYDPTRHHYPNQGNPGLTYSNDQVGLNARSFEDVLLMDAALLGLADEHEKMRRAVDAINPGNIRVGLPVFPFVTMDLPADAFNAWGLRNFTLSANLKAKYDAVVQTLAKHGFAAVHEEWPEIESAFFNRKVNSCLDTLFSNRRINNLDYDPLFIPHLHSSSGQAAEWIKTYLSAEVSNQEVWDHALDGGDGHTPHGDPGASATTDETQMRYQGHAQAEKLVVWNSYFEAHNVDVIMAPAQPCDAVTYHGMADSTQPLMVQQPDGSFAEEPASLVQCLSIHFIAFKDIPVPKVIVPTGLDPQGRPTAVAFWGKGVPLNKLFDDRFAREHDLRFLHTVRRLAAVIQATEGLARAEPPCVVRDLYDDAKKKDD